MSLFLTNRDGGKTDEQGHLKQLDTFSGEVITGLNVTQDSPVGYSVLLGVGTGMVPRSAYRYLFWNDAPLSIPVSTPHATLPRRDFVIVYIDLGATVSPTTANNPGIPKAIVVAGTPGTVPADPTTTQIQASAVGASNPYIILRRIDVPAAASNITNAMLTVDKRNFATNILPHNAQVNTLSADTSLTSADEINLVDAGAAARAIVLPDPSGLTGRKITVRKTDSSANKVTITTAVGNIGGVATAKLSLQNQQIRVMSDGTNWVMDDPDLNGYVVVSSVLYPVITKSGSISFLTGTNDVDHNGLNTGAGAFPNGVIGGSVTPTSVDANWNYLMRGASVPYNSGANLLINIHTYSGTTNQTAAFAWQARGY